MSSYNVKSTFYGKDRTTPWDLLLWSAEGFGPFRTVSDLAHSIANSKGCTPTNYKLVGVVQGKPFSFEKYSYTLDGTKKGYAHEVFEATGLDMSTVGFDELKLEMELSQLQTSATTPPTNQTNSTTNNTKSKPTEPDPDSDDGEGMFDLFG